MAAISKTGRLSVRVRAACMIYAKNNLDDPNYTWEKALKHSGYKQAGGPAPALDNPHIQDYINSIRDKLADVDRKYDASAWLFDVKRLALDCIASGDKKTATICYQMLGEHLGCLGQGKGKKIGKQQNILITSNKEESIVDLEKKVRFLQEATDAGTAIAE